MPEGQEQKSRQNFYHLMIGIVSFLLFFAVTAITTMRFSSFVGGELPSQVIYACALIGFILIFNSVVHTLTFYDTDGFSSFKARKIKNVKLNITKFTVWSP